MVAHVAATLCNPSQEALANQPMLAAPNFSGKHGDGRPTLGQVRGDLRK
jgi:hypothetical protein